MQPGAGPNCKWKIWVRVGLGFFYIYMKKPLGEILIWWRGNSRFKSLGKGANDYTTPGGGPGQQQQGGQSDILKHAKIGKFGEMVLGKSNVSFRCRTAPIIEIRAPLPPQKRFTPFHSFISHRIYIHTYIYFSLPFFFFSLIQSHRSHPKRTRAKAGSVP